MKRLIFILLVLSIICLASCDRKPRDNTLRIGYTEFAFDQAVAFVLKAILDQQPNLVTELYRVPDSTMFRALAANELDVGISAWVPYTHQRLLDMHQYGIRRHSLMCDSLGLYMLVPEYMQIDRIGDLRTVGEQISNTVLIPESRNAIFHHGNGVLDDYGLSTFTLQESSWDNIMSFVEEAIKNNSGFAFVGMRPHWSMRRHNLKALDDPEKSFGSFEQAFLVINNQLPERMPAISLFLSRVRFNLRDIEQLMEMNQVMGSEPYENAIRWINQNTNRINRWLM
jgi:glycine betaine/proline transport system substrate-binding protein